MAEIDDASLDDTHKPIEREDRNCISRNILDQDDDPVNCKASWPKFDTASDPQSVDLYSSQIYNEFKNSDVSDSECGTDLSSIADDGDDDELQELSDFDDTSRIGLWVNEKRYSGDGEEQPDAVSERKLDDDEDKLNPAYIPRKGSFFEHDLRKDDCGNCATELKQTKKNIWVDRTKWQHDKFDKKFQAPKSREEIVAVYGFDIREKDCLPLEIVRKSSKTRISKKEQCTNFLGEWLRTDKRKAINCEKQFCPRRSWPEAVLQSRKATLRPPPNALAMSTTDVTSAHLREQNETATHLVESEHCHQNFNLSVVKDNELPKSKLSPFRRKTNFNKFKESKIVKFANQRIVGHEPKYVLKLENSSQNLDRQLAHSKKIAARNTDRKKNMNCPATCNDTFIYRADVANLSSSCVKKSQDVRMLQSEKFLTASHQSDCNVGGDLKNENCGSRRSKIIIQTTMAPEIIPPVTRIPTYNKSVEPKSSTSTMSSNTTNETHANSNEVGQPYTFTWSGREFVPNQYLFQNSQSVSKLKRYSSQRQKVSSQDGDPTGSRSREDDSTDNDVVTLPDSVDLNSSTTERPCHTAPYYVNSNVSSSHLRVYNVPAILSQTMTVPIGAHPLMQAAYFNSQGMLHSAYLSPTVVNYGATLTPRFPFATGTISVEFPTGSSKSLRTRIDAGNPLEVRGGTVYFNPEIQQVDAFHGTMYFNTEKQAPGSKSLSRRTKVAIPIVKPKDLVEKDCVQQQQRITNIPSNNIQYNEGNDGKDNSNFVELPDLVVNLTEETAKNKEK